MVVQVTGDNVRDPYWDTVYITMIHMNISESILVML